MVPVRTRSYSRILLLQGWSLLFVGFGIKNLVFIRLLALIRQILSLALLSFVRHLTAIQFLLTRQSSNKFDSVLARSSFHHRFCHIACVCQSVVPSGLSSPRLSVPSSARWHHRKHPCGEGGNADRWLSSLLSSLSCPLRSLLCPWPWPSGTGA